MMDRVSVTEVRNALRCPRVFALGKKRGRALAFPVGSSCLGATFHRIVERFAQQVESPPAAFRALRAVAERDDVEAELAAWLLRELVRELDADSSYASIPGEVDDLAEALRELGRHLTARLRSFSVAPSEGLRRIVRRGEQLLEAELEPGGPLLSGRPDALYGDAQGGLEVVEYKLTDDANDALDRAQVALYRALLGKAANVHARAVVLRFMPTLRETQLADTDADALVERVLVPLLGDMRRWAERPEDAPPTERRDLCASCPLATECVATYPTRLPVRDDPPANAAHPRPDPSLPTLQSSAVVAPIDAPHVDEEGTREALELKARIVEELKKQGVSVTSQRPPVVGPTLYLIDVSRPRGTVAALDRAAEDVRHRLASDGGIDVDYVRDGGRRRFCVRRAHPRRVPLAELLAAQHDYLAEKPGRFVLGQIPEGDVVCGDFSDPSTPHLLVAGSTGSGKSYLLRAIIASLVQYHGPESLRFTLIDPKRVTFTVPSFQAAVAAHLDGPVGYDAEDALPVVERLVELMDERYRLMERERVSDIDELNELRPSGRLERKIVVVDEFGELAANRALATAFFDAIGRLGAKARAAGIHLVLATQRPDKATVPPTLKANLGGKVALKVASAVNSRIILDEAGAEKLLGKGDLLANLGHGVVRAQAPVIDER